MPYRHAHYWLLALFPLIVIAFWPGYFGHVRTARAAQHAHGVSATIWLVLVMVQSWSTHTRRFAWHRAAGLAVFAIVPVFAAAGLYGIHDMAREMNAGSPFEAFAAPGLATDDLAAIVALVGFVAAALATRRQVRRHAGWMLATALLVIPPMTTRLYQVLLHSVGVESPSFTASFWVGMGSATLAALFLARGRGADGRPFLVLAAVFAAQIVTYYAFRDSVGWRAMLGAFGDMPPAPAVMIAGLLALGALVLGWRAVPRRGRSHLAQAGALPLA